MKSRNKWGEKGAPELPPFQAEHRTRHPVCGLPGLAGRGKHRQPLGVKTSAGGSSPGDRVGAGPALGRSLGSLGAMRHLCWRPTRRPRPLLATRTRFATLRLHTPKWLPEPAEPPGSVLGSPPTPPRRPCRFPQNVP